MGSSSSFIISCPCNGQIQFANEKEIRIYIRPTDNHLIFAPVGGLIKDVKMIHGNFINETTFHTFEEKTGKLSIIIIDELSRCVIELWILVGKPEFITDSIYFGKKIGQSVVQGDQVAEILIGSMAGIKILDTQLQTNFVFKNKLFLHQEVYAKDFLSEIINKH